MEGTAVKYQTEAGIVDSVRIIAMLYDGAANFMKKAREKLKVGDSVGRSHYISRTTAIVRELSNSLNMESGEIALNLRNLYDFVLESLIKADVQNSLDALGDAEKVMEILRSSWEDMQEARSALAQR